MTYLTHSDSIEKIGLSARSYNALRRNGIHTIEALLALDPEQINLIKNLGVKSLDEIVNLQNEIKCGGYSKLAESGDIGTINSIKSATIPSLFFDAAGNLCRDMPLSELALSFRANRILTEAGYKFASALQNVTTEKLLELPNMGKSTVNEIILTIAKLEFETVNINNKDASQVEASCMEFVHSFVRHIPTHAGELYENLLPYYENACEYDLLVDNDSLFKVPILRNLIAEKIIAILECNFFGISREEIFCAFPDALVSENTMNMVLHELSTQGRLLLGETIEIDRPTLWEYVNSISDDKQRQLLTLRLNGKSLEEIGSTIGVTRERVRQIIKKCLNKKQVVIREDKYQKIYETYSFSKEDFVLAFDTDDSVYTYLTLVCKEAGDLPIEQFLEDAAYPVELRKDTERAVYKNYFIFDGIRVLKRRAELVDYVVHAYFQEETRFDAFVETYNNILNELNLVGDSRFALNDRTYQNRLADADNVLWKYPSRFRYYDMTGRDFTALLYGLNMEQYIDAEYSSLKFFRSHPELMDEYDLRDEYELHNLLKKLYSKNQNSSLTFSRMPMIEFGNADRNNQVLDLLIHLAPINVEEFCIAYEAEYGVLARTVAGSFLACIDIYRDSSGMYDISAEPLPAEQMLIMKKLLQDDYYDISLIVQLYLREFPTAHPNMINSYTLKSMGFNVFSSYVIKNSYANAAEYFRHILTAEDIVETKGFSATLTSQISFTNELYNMKNRYEIVEFEPLRYINRRRLEQLGVTVQDMINYCDQVADFIKPKNYFTIHSLRQQGFVHALYDLRFDDWFYASILSEDKERYRYQRMGGTKVFCKNVKHITMEDLFGHVIQQHVSINIYDFIELLKDEYEIKIGKHKVIEVISSSTIMYYDRVMEQIRQNNVTINDLPNDDDCEKAKYIIATKFKNGYRVSSNIDFERFKSFYVSEYAENFTFELNNLEYILSSFAVVYDDRAYVYNAEAIDSVRTYFEQTDSPCIYINTFFEKFSEELYAHGIFSIDLLKAFIEKNYSNIQCKGNYIYLQHGITPTDLVRKVFVEQETWTIDELYSRFPFIKEDTVRQILNRDEYFRVETNVFTHINNIILPEDEGEKVANFVKDSLRYKDYTIASELDLSQFERLNPHYPFLVIRDAVFNKFLAGHFSKSGQVITHRGDKLRVFDILEQFCREVETISLEELNSFEAMFDPKGRTHSLSLNVANNIMVRVSNKLFVADNRFSFDVEGIDGIIALYCRENFIPIRSIVDFTLFPCAEYPWNSFLLESYVRKFSHLFKFDVRAANSSNIGVIVRKSFAYNRYDEILAIALAKSQTPLDNAKAVGDYLYDVGYIGWRNLGKSEKNILDRAKKLREEAVN